MEQPLISIEWRQFLGFAARVVLREESYSRAVAQLGQISLLPHQLEAISRIEFAIERFGGALLADDVGLGKTFVALAIAKRLALRTVLVAPAALRDMWIQSSRRAQVELRSVSLESLALLPVDAPPLECDLLIVDEAHNLRNPNTLRYKQVAAIARRTRILLLSATPVHNRERELHALLALFMGAKATALDSRELALVVVRRERNQIQNDALLPAVVHAAPPTLPSQDNLLNAIMGLPPPVPPIDGGDGGALVTFTLVRQWASSNAAFVRALNRRIAFGNAMLLALEHGIHPRVKELHSWCASDEAIQLPLFGLLPRTAGIAAHDFEADTLSASIRSHVDAVRALLGLTAKAGPVADAARADAIRVIRDAHDGEKIIAFSQFTETTRALFRRSLSWSRCAMLTATTAAIASGRIPRAELISLFAPISNGSPVPPDVRRVDLLFSTDVLSEGANLQDASVLIHLDLPWTPVRLSQRVGRVARAGSLAQQVTVYSFPPPASAESLLHMERRLSAKLSVAARSVGVASGVLPLLHLATPTGSSAPQLDAQLRDLLRSYRSDSFTSVPGGSVLVAGLTCSVEDGFIAIVEQDGSTGLVSGTWPGGNVHAGLTRVIDLLQTIGKEDRNCATRPFSPSSSEASAVVTVLQRWTASRGAHAAAGLHTAAYARARRRLIRRIDTISVRTPAHLRPRIHKIAATARQVATNAYGSAAEQVLAELADATMPDEAWLRAVECFGELQKIGSATADAGNVRVLGVLILRRN